MITLVSCVSMKGRHACDAASLYTSPWFQKARAYVATRKWFILSAKHGLLNPNRWIAPYDESLHDMTKDERRLWADRVLAKLALHVCYGDEVQVLAGEKYREFVVPGLEEMGAVVHVPMRGLGIGEQLKWLTDRTNT